MPYAIEIGGLCKAYGDQQVLRGLDLAVEAGSVFSLLGPNGAGKTTTVRILATLLRPDAGSVRVAGHDALADPRAVRAAISLTGQYAAVDDLLTGDENLVLMGRLHRLGRAGARRRAEELLERFDLVGAAARRVATYSGGMRRRLDLAVSLLAHPAVVFLDEPTTGLDPRSRRAVWDAVGELCSGGTTVLLTTQYLEEADRLADRIALIDGGRIAAEGTADELKRRLAGEAVELTFASPDAVRRAGGVLGNAAATGVAAAATSSIAAEVAGAPAPLPVAVDEARLALRVPTDGSADEVRRLLDVLDGAGVHVERVAVHRPTLDDVFLALTDRDTRA